MFKFKKKTVVKQEQDKKIKDAERRINLLEIRTQVLERKR